MKQRIVISGLGGQGVITLTRILAEAANTLGCEVITSETHGMAQRGGVVMSTVKVGPFRGPLIGSAAADVGLFLAVDGFSVHGHLLKKDAGVYVNTRSKGNYENVDAAELATLLDCPRALNLVLLGFAAGRRGLFAPPDDLEAAIRMLTPASLLETNLQAFHLGLEAKG